MIRTVLVVWCVSAGLSLGCNAGPPTQPTQASSPSPAEAVVSGFVNSADTRDAIGGARVTVSAGSVERSGTSDAAGSFRIEQVPAGSVSLTVDAAGFGRATRLLTVPAHGLQIDIEMATDSAPVATVRGTVRSQSTNQPLPGADISLRLTDDRRFSATSDSDGRFEMPAVPLGATGDVRVEAPGYQASDRRITVEADLEMEFSLERTAPPPPVFATALRLVSTFNQAALAGGLVAGTGLTAPATDLSGRTVVVADASSPAPRAITITAGAALERRTFLRVPGEEATIDLIPSSFDLRSFDLLARSYQELIRWADAPGLTIERRILECSATTPTESLAQTTPAITSAATLAEMTGHLTDALSPLTGGRFTGYGSVETPLADATATVNLMVPGRITIARCTRLAELTGAVGYSKIDFAGNGRVKGGVVVLDYDYDEAAPPAERFHVRAHELGHMLGFNHVEIHSIMAITGAASLTFTPWDLEAMALAYRRPPGSRSPDVDPDGASANALGARSALVLCRGWRR
ncbi:MAG: carboxypeptidase regulatory-like domain-containing protein [Acidobacteria bacterium]|nr:carboxypeptidase regulatory-like domain-containing protein [Acidobacteriota bacterium]